MSSRFERTAARTIYEGKIITVRMDTFRHEDGEEVEREIALHPGAVGIVAHDGESIYLVRQPREPVDSPDLLELPAGKLDGEGEGPLETAKRELAEEIGKAADEWESLGSFYTSPGFSNEEVHLFLATGLRDVQRPEVEEDERIDLCVHPLTELDSLIDQARDSKTLIGLHELRRRLGSL
jgi:8-oxo-dGTP pyrophosphatase MutT (NUDIX family)